MNNKVFTLFTAILMAIHCQYESSSCFYGGKIAIWAGTALTGIASHTYVAGGYDFPITWVNSLINITSAALSMSAFEITPANVLFSFDTTFTYSSTTGNINILLFPGSQINYLFYNIIIVNTCSGKIEAATKLYTSTILNQSGRTSNQQYFNYISPTFPTFSTNSSDYHIGVFIQSFKSSSYTPFIAATFNNISLTYISVKIYSQTACNCVLYQVKISIIISQLSTFNDKLIPYSSYLSVSSFQINLGIPSKFNPGFYSTRCVYGIYFLNTNSAIGPSYSYLVKSANDSITGIGFQNIPYLGYNIICLAACSYGYVINPTVSNSICVICSSVIPLCLQCLNSTHCSLCNSFCNGVTNGTCIINCTIIHRCVTCSVVSNNLNCQTCQIGYHSNSTNCNPQCGDGYITPDQECDDGNAISNDGCSISCKFELRFYCIINLTINVCYPCSSYCLSCSRSDMCIQCQATAFLLKRTYSTVCYNNSCPVNYFGRSISSTVSHCIPCPYDCLICSNQTTCTSCQLGLIVQGGCSRSSGCIKVVQDAILMRSPCVTCEDSLILNWQVCVCPFGQWMVTRYCTNVIGCVTTSFVNNIVNCINCDKTKVLALINGSCLCVPGMILNSSGICQQICGDGKLYRMACDDGNTIDGDGCSSKCLVQSKYSCMNGSATHRSICIYQGKDFKITFNSVDKVQNQNKAIITLNFYPTLKNFDSLSLIDNIQLSCNKTASLTGWSYSQGKMQLQVDYGQDIQGVTASIDINFNHAFVPQADINIKCDMTSKGVKLSFISSYGSAKTMQYVFLGFNCLIIFVFLLGSASHKMIGVETIHSFQLIYFLHSMSGDYTLFFSMFKFFTYLNGNFMYLINKQLNMPNPANSFPFSSGNQQISTIGIFSSIALFSFISLIFKLISIKHTNQAMKRKYDKFSIKIYNHSVFPMVLGFYLITTLSFNIFVDNTRSKLFLNFIPIFGGAIYFTTMILNSIIINFEGKGLIIKSNHRQVGQDQYYGLVECCPSHIPTYIAYIFLVSFSSILNYLRFFQFSQMFIVGLTIFFFLKYCCYRPYTKSVHNIGLILNFLMVIIFGSWCILRNTFSVLLNSDNEFIIFTVVIIIMFLSIFVSICRIIIEIKQKLVSNNFKIKKNEGYKQNEANIKQKQINKILEKNKPEQPLNIFNKYYSKVIEQKQKIDDWNDINRERLLKNIDIIYNKQDVEKTIQGFSQIFRQKAEKNDETQNQLKCLKEKLKKNFKKKLIDPYKIINKDQQL